MYNIYIYIYVYYNCVYIGKPIYIYIYIVYTNGKRFQAEGLCLSPKKVSGFRPWSFPQPSQENWLESLDETLQQHGVSRCDEGTKRLGRLLWDHGIMGPVGSWFASPECVSLSSNVIYIYIWYMSLSSSLFSHVICIFIILHHKTLLLLTRQSKSFVWLEVYRQNSSWSLDQTLCHLAYDFYRLKPSFRSACFSQNGIYTPLMAS